MVKWANEMKIFKVRSKRKFIPKYQISKIKSGIIFECINYFINILTIIHLGFPPGLLVSAPWIFKEQKQRINREITVYFIINFYF